MTKDYHSYRILGVENDVAKKFDNNQRQKEPIIIAYIAMALAKARENIGDKVSFIELFCADAYYAMIAKRLNADTVVALDSGKEKWFHGVPDRLKAMGLENDIELRKMDVNNIDCILEPFDIVLNAGGLYHVDDPAIVLNKSYNLARKYLIVQSVVKNKFVPAQVTDRGWKIMDSHSNKLKSGKLDSVYYLIEK